MDDGSGSTSYTYDAQGRVDTKTQTVRIGDTDLPRLTLDADYEPVSGRLARLTLPSGVAIGYDYRADGGIAAIRINGQVVVRDVRHFPFGAVQEWTTGSGLTYRRTFDPDGRIEDFSLPESTRTLGYDLAGRIEGLSDSSGAPAWLFGYDALDRLDAAENTATTGPLAGLDLGWTYDATGNRASETENGVALAYQIDPASNRLIQVGPSARNYDAAGNTQTADGRTSIYNGRNRLAEVRLGSQTLATYRTNAFGERVLKAVTGATRQYLYDEDGHLLGEYDQYGALIAEHIWLADTPVAVLVPAASHPGGVVFGDVALFHVWPDHLDTPRALSDAAGTVVWRWESAPFGDTSAQGDPDGDGHTLTYNLRFPGQYFDAETGYHYNYFRDYEAGTGRYLQSDPIGLDGQSLSTYPYVLNAPLASADATGEAGSIGNWLDRFKWKRKTKRDLDARSNGSCEVCGIPFGNLYTGTGPNIHHRDNKWEVIRDAALAAICNAPNDEERNRIIAALRIENDDVTKLLHVCEWCHDDLHGNKRRDFKQK